MTAEEKYLVLIRNIRRRINDTVSTSPVPGEQVVFSNEDLKDEIDLSVRYIGFPDILALRDTHYELVILRVWYMIAKILAFDSAKFFTITQTNQTINKGERTNHYLSVAQNLENLFAKAQDDITGGITVGDIKVLDRDTLQENTAIADTPPSSIYIKAVTKLVPSADNDYKEGDYLVEWERSHAWDFNQYKFYIGDTANITKDTGRILFAITNNLTTQCRINLVDYTGTKYLVAYVTDNRELYSDPSETFEIVFSTGSV